MTNNISILLVDDHNLFRAGLKEIIKKESKYFVIGEASDGNELIEKCIKLKPDVVISDLLIPKIDGISAILKSKNKIPTLRSIIVSMDYNKFNIHKAWKAGINGMLGKDCDEGEFMLALSDVANNGLYFSGIKDESELNEISEQLEPPKSEKENFNISFTNKEKELLDYLEKGMASEQIADEMCIGKRTVDFYRAKLIQKLNFKTTNELIAFAVKYKIYNKYRDF